MLALGWRTERDPHSHPPAHSPTLDVLDELAGSARTGWRVTGTDLAVATTARAVIRQDNPFLVQARSQKEGSGYFVYRGLV